MAAETITEAASEKRGRGRPPVFCRALMEFEASGPCGQGRARTQRGVVNRCYQSAGLEVLVSTGRFADFAWIADDARPGAVRAGILEELGRMRLAGFGDAFLVSLAEDICRERPPVKEAQRVLRGYRLHTLKGANHGTDHD